MDETRVARTESAFREVNEAIAQTSFRFGSRIGHFICECADPQCAQRVELDLEEYEAVRADPTRFLLAPGHELPARERVVERRGDHETVEKVGTTMRRVVRRLDPRSRAQPEIT